MTERSSTIPSLNGAYPPIPLQSRGLESRHGVVELTSLQQVADVAKNGVALAGNLNVYALVTNALSELAPEQIQGAKGKDRELDQPLGLTMSLGDPLLKGTFDLSAVRNKELYRALQPDKLPKLLGALAFVRVNANVEAVHRNGLTDIVLSQPKPSQPRTIQVWMPDGNESATELVTLMRKQGSVPVMTSANETGQDEIAYNKDAFEFARRKKLPIYVDLPNDQRLGRGSNTIFEATPYGLRPLRAGFVHPGLWAAILGDLLRYVPIKPHTYPDHVITIDHIPRHARNAKGEDMRKYVLEAMYNFARRKP